MGFYMKNVKTWYEYFKSSISREMPEDTINPTQEYPKLKTILKHFIPIIKQHWKIAVMCAVIPMLVSVAAIPVPMVARYLVDNIILTRNIHYFIPVLVVLGILKLIPIILQFLLKLLNLKFERSLTLELNKMIYEKLTALPKSFFDKNQTGYIMSRIMGNVQVIKWFFTDIYSSSFSTFIRFIAGLSFLFYLEWRLAILMVISLPFSFIGIRFLLKKNYVLNHYTSEIGSQAAASKHEVFNSISLVKAFSTEKQTVKKLLDLIKLDFKVSNEKMAFGVIENFIRDVVPLIIRVIVFVVGVYWIIKGEWELGSLYAFQSYMASVSAFPNSIVVLVKQFQNNKVSLERTSVLLDALPEENTETGIDVSRLKGGLEFNNVTFYYQKDKIILKNISFKINEGEHWAVIGESGIGKSTLISLIMRFYKPQEGAIYYDGIDAVEYNVRGIRRRIGYVSQATDLLKGTIFENITYGNRDAAMDDVIKAAKTASIHDFIDALPNKYDSIVGEHGVNFSEGQKQRISIARALVKNSDILIFDEPTSALDNVTEASIYSSIPKYQQGKTVITIAHRLSTIKNADKILLLAPNNEYFIGKHSELFHNNDIYKEFFNTIAD